LHTPHLDRAGRDLDSERETNRSLDAAAGRGIVLADDVEPGADAGDALVWLRHIIKSDTSAGRYVVERTPLR
jgi:hypothetical protein